MPTPKRAKPLMSTREVAMVLDMSPDEVALLARKGVIKGKKVGRGWRFDRKAVMQLGKQRMSEE
ncbi:helix-turn-helix domain-containing protein [Thermodesulfobacteriota bacterium]